MGWSLSRTSKSTRPAKISLTQTKNSSWITIYFLLFTTMSMPLSIFTFYKRNLRRVIPVLAILAFSILGVTASAAIAGSLTRDLYKHNSLYSSFFTVHYQPLDAEKYKLEDVEKRVKEIKNSELYFKGELRRTYSTGVLGLSPEWVFYLNKDDYKVFMNEIKWDLVEGNFPDSKNNEVVLTEKLMLNRNLKINDKIGTKIDNNDMLPGEHKVVGKIKENGLLIGGIGSLENLVSRDTDLDYTFYIKPKFGAKEALDQEVKQIEKDFPGVEIRTEYTEKVYADTQLAIVRSLVWSLDVIVMLVICISVALLNVIYFMQRSQEFGVLSALGYTKDFLLKKTFLESLGLTIIAWILGVGIAEGVYALLNSILFNPKGIEGLTVLEPGTFIFSLPVPITITIFSLITVYWHFSRMDAIAIIEKRD